MREGWTRVRLGELGRLLKARGGTKKDEAPTGVPVVRYGELYTRHGEVIRRFYSFVPEDKAAAYTRLTPGDILFAGSGETLDEIGRSAAFLGPEPALAGADLIVLRPERPVVSEFLGYATNAPNAVAQKRRFGQGSSVFHIHADRLADLEIPLPPLDEQRRIAAVLSAIDAVRDRQTKCADTTRNLMGAYTSALMGPGIPKAPLGELCERITDGTHQAVKVLDAGEVPFLYVSCVRDGAIRWHHAKRISQPQYVEVARGREPRRGDVLYTAVGSYGHAALVPDDRAFAFQRHIAFIRPDRGRLDASYLVHWLNSPAARSHADTVAVGNAQKTITLAALRDLPVPVPPLHEQRRVGGFLDAVQRRVAAEEAFAERYGDLKAAVARTLLGATG